MKKLVKTYKERKKVGSSKFTGYLLNNEFLNQEKLDNMKTIEEFTKLYFKYDRKDY